MSSNITELTSANFDLITQQHTIVVIDFWASWCEPCLAFKSVFESVASQYTDVSFASVNIEAETQLAEEFNIRSVPFLIILKEQVLIYAEAGALTQSALVDLLEQAKASDLKEVHEAIKKHQQKQNN